MNARLELARYTDPRPRALRRRPLPAPLLRPPRADQPHIDEDERITDPIEGRSNCHVAPAEWRFFGWLDREGCDYDLYAETQLHDGTLDLGQYRAPGGERPPGVLVGEDVLRAEGVGLSRGGGEAPLPRRATALNCEVEFPRRHDDHRPQRALRRRLLPPAEDRLREPLPSAPRVGGQPPRRDLLGDRDHDRRPRTASSSPTTGSSRTPACGRGDLFGQECLHMRCPGGASGHENRQGFRPARRPTPGPLAKGLNPRRRRRRDRLLRHPPPAGTCSRWGSISWPASLPVDEQVSRITPQRAAAVPGLTPRRPDPLPATKPPAPGGRPTVKRSPMPAALALEASLPKRGPLPADPQQAERETIAACRRGDLGAYERIFRDHWRRLLSVALRMLGDQADAEDAVADRLHPPAPEHRPLPRRGRYRQLSHAHPDQRLPRRAEGAAAPSRPQAPPSPPPGPGPGPAAAVAGGHPVAAGAHARPCFVLYGRGGLPPEGDRRDARDPRGHREGPGLPGEGAPAAPS